jgi:hypothetical protein
VDRMLREVFGAAADLVVQQAGNDADRCCSMCVGLGDDGRGG